MREERAVQLPRPDKSPGLHPSSDDGVMTLIGHNNDTSVPPAQ